MFDETGHWKQCSSGKKHTCTVCGYSETAPFEDVAPGTGITAESENTDTSGKTVIFIALTAFAAVTAAIVVRRKVRRQYFPPLNT